MSKQWYLVEGHIDGDYWDLVDETNPDQECEIEETCPMCGDNDWIVGFAGTLEEARKLCGHNYDSDYGRDMFEEFKRLVEAQDDD